MYMTQPEEFSTHVCKLKKVLYGYLKLSRCLQQMDFKGSNSNAYMILYNKDGDTIIFLIYVDNTLVTMNNPNLIKGITCRLL